MADIPVKLSFSFVDAIGVPASTDLYATTPDTSTVAQVVTAANAYLSAVAALTEDGIVSAGATLVLDVSAHLNPASDSDSEEGLLVNYSQVGSKYKYGIWIPGLIDALVVGGKIDLTNAALVAFNTLLTSVGGVLDARSKYQLLIGGLKDAAEAFRKLRRRAEKITKTNA